MRLLTSEKKHLFVDKLIKLRQQLNAFKPKNTLQSLELFENQLTLNEMETCFFDSEPDEINTNLIHLLSSRWERIRYSNMCYTQQPDNLVNQLCFEIAKEIAPPASTASEIEALEPNTGPYSLLMPSLENTEDVYGNNIHSLGLHEFVLSDNARVFIPLAQCLHQASVSDEGRLRHTVAIGGGYPELTPTEIERVSHHSKQAEEFYQSIIALNKQRLLADDIGAKLSQLARALRGGGARGSGSELNAGAEANLGILAFGEYWEALSDRQKLAIFTEEPKLKDVLGRLFRPNDVNYKETRFCVELLAGALDPIIQRYNQKPTIRTLHEHVLKQENAFKMATQNHHGLAMIPKEVSPKHILHRIFKLNIDEQKVLFKQQGYESALKYALAHEPEALAEFELDAAQKQQAATANNGSALIVAAKSGKTDAVRLLLNWGAQIESRTNVHNDTALIWAACNGHTDVVNCLLDNGALLEGRGNGNNTALNIAVMVGKASVVNLLLQKNANVNARNNEGKNALDIALEKHPELVEAILMHVATLSLEQQAECLLNVPDGPYENVLLYASDKKPILFDAIINKILEQPNEALYHATFNSPNKHGVTPLIFAAKLGAHDAIGKLLASGVDIESRTNVHNDTALIWAACNGHTDVVNCLLDNGALLEAPGYKGDTALTCAIKQGRRSVVDLLLKKNANVNARNTEGKNALDIAIEKRPELVEAILMHVATLPLEQQAECLLKVPDGPYPSVIFYVAAKKPAIFDAVIDKVLQQPPQELRYSICNARNQRELNSLIRAAQLGAHKSIPKLLALGLDIESHDANKDTALHWAAHNGHADAVSCLLDNGALLEARGYKGDTALTCAIKQGRRSVVDLLLKKNANVNARNTEGKNALDIAIEKRPKLVEAILMHVATLPLEQQAECLLKVPDGPYENIYAYVAVEKPEFFNSLLKEWNASTPDITNILAKMHFDEHIKQISKHYQLMKKKSLGNSNYTDAALAAKTLLIECGKAKVALFQSNATTDVKIFLFKNTCKSAIETAKPVLKKYREWGKVLAAFLLAVITLPVSLPLYAIGLFSVKTKSEQLIDKLHEAVDKPNL